MNIALRLIACFVTILSLSVATAWAWDKSEQVQATYVVTP